ncbi:MAG: hypothetical protein WC977_07650 [Anaerovoracaceae bacterium]
MSYRECVIICCDVVGCGREYAADNATTVSEARKAAQADGWIVKGGKQQKDICPQCNARLFGAEEASSEHTE